MIEQLGKGKARFRVSVGSGENRVRYTKTVTYSGKRELQKLYADFEAECRREPLTDMTVSEMISAYIEKRKRTGIKATTELGYRTAEKRVQPLTERILAKRLTTVQLDDFVALWLEKGYSPKTISNTLGLVSAAYDDAIRIGYLEHNPCKAVTMPKKSKKEIQTFSEEEVYRFLDALKDERLDYKVGYELCLLCGMRRSEVLGLRESDIDLGNKCVSISNTRHRVYGETVEQDTKTERSRRVLALPDMLVRDIADLIAEHSEFVWNRSEYLIQDGFGKPMNPASMTNHLVRLERNANLPNVSVHGLRHTFATMLNSDGVDIARISAELGHSNIGTTINIYTHVFGGTTASSRGIADSFNKRFEKNVTFLPQSEMKKASER